MTTKQRLNSSAEFKAQATVEAIMGRRIVQKIAAHRGILRRSPVIGQNKEATLDIEQNKETITPNLGR